MSFLISIPFTGLGLYGGYRGDRWLRNRIEIFKNFTLKSLLNQTDRDFVCWFQWRSEEKGNKYILELEQFLKEIPNFTFVFTYGGVCMYDDKYEDGMAKERLIESLRISLPTLFDFLPGEKVIQLLQPSDDCYRKDTVALIKKVFTQGGSDAVSFSKGYLCNYNTKEVLEYNPKTNPPFAAIQFPRETFFDVLGHCRWIALKEDAGKYLKGTPLPSHEYLPKCLKTAYFDFRGFLVGVHGENISTHFNHPYGGEEVQGVLDDFGIMDSPLLVLPISFRKWVMRRLPYPVQRKLRYWFGEVWGMRIYNFLRN